MMNKKTKSVCINIDYTIHSIPEVIQDFVTILKQYNKNILFSIVAKNKKFENHFEDEVDSYDVKIFSILNQNFETYRLISPKNYLYLLERQDLVIDIYQTKEDKIFVAYNISNPFVNYSKFESIIYSSKSSIINHIFENYEPYEKLGMRVIKEISLLLCKESQEIVELANVLNENIVDDLKQDGIYFVSEEYKKEHYYGNIIPCESTRDFFIISSPGTTSAYHYILGIYTDKIYGIVQPKTLIVTHSRTGDPT